MKKIIYILALFLFANLNATEKQCKKRNEKKSVSKTVITPQALLKSKKWNIMGKSLDIYFEYTDIEETLYADGQNIGRGKYYISDNNCFNQPYDINKVGQISSGRFLKTENGCYYITVVNENTVQLSYLSTTNPQTTTLIAKL
jgi:hypothetical protein